MAPPVLQCPPPAVSVPGRECCRAGWWWVPCAGGCVRSRMVVDPMGTVCALWVSPWGPTVGLCGSCGSGGPSGIEGTWAKSCHMGDVLLHCRGRLTPAPQPALAGLWAQMCAPRGTNGPGTLYLWWYSTLYHAMLVPRAGGMATEQLWGQAVWHPWAQPCRVPLGPALLSPVQLGSMAPRGPIPSLQRVPACKLSPKSLSQRLMAVVDWAPQLPSIPATFGCPPHSSPLPAQPYPFQVELSWGGGSRGARRGGEGVRGDEREKRSKKGQHWGERAGHPTSYKKPRGLKTAVSYKISS